MLKALQRSQVSVQALTRLANVCLFLLASWVQPERLPLVALQGVLLAVPYTLMEALIGRPLAAGIVPDRWDVEAWARRASAVVAVPVALAGYLTASVALPSTGVVDRLLLVAPVVLQVPVEALFWATTRSRSRSRANLIPQLTAVGTVVAGVACAASGLRLEVAAGPAQLLVLAWVLTASGAGEKPGWGAAVRTGWVYAVTAAVDLSYTVALPAVAGAVVGPAAIVALRGLDLAFGPFHVALSAGTREDLVAGRQARWATGTRALTVALLVAVSAAVLASDDVRGLLAADLAALATGAVALYCAYKCLLMLSTWLATRHMISAAPRRFLVSAVGSRVIAFAAVAVAVATVTGVTGLFLLLMVAEAAVAAWYAVRLRT